MLHKNRGSTTLGIILGVIVGLVIALGVTLYLAYSSAPITIKKGAEPNSTAPAKPGVALPDPNEALYAKPKPADPASAADSASGAASAAASAGAAAKPDKPSKAAADADDAIAKIAKAHSGPQASTQAVATSPSAVPSTAGERFMVQAGAYKSLSDAEAMRARLALLGVETRLNTRDADSGAIHRVRTPSMSAESAEKTKALLKDNGIDSSLVKLQ